MCGEIPLPFLHFFLSFGRVCLRLVCWCARVRGCGCNPRGRDGTRLGRREGTQNPRGMDEKRLGRREGTQKLQRRDEARSSFFPVFAVMDAK